MKTLRTYVLIEKIYHCVQTGAIVLQPHNPFDRVNLPRTIDYLQCNGEESQLSDCAVNTQEVDTCGRYEVAGVVCQGT